MAKKRNPAEETDSDLLIDMQDIVKTFNIGTPNELTDTHLDRRRRKPLRSEHVPSS